MVAIEIADAGDLPTRGRADAARMHLRETVPVDDFNDYYERYRAHCIRAGVAPLTPQEHRAKVEEWDSLLGHWWDTEPRKAGDGDNQREQSTH